MNQFELHPERLATTDEKGGRIYVHPADVKGKYRTKRTVVQAFLILFFLALPWLKINGRQALLLDIVHRKFEILGMSLRAHNAPLLFFVFAAAGFGLFFVTAVWGRVWCGWACPQTVFIDGVFRRIERFIEGSAAERRKLDSAPMSASKVGKRAAKWTLFTLASLVITHSFLAYFVGTEELATMVTSSPLENWGSFLFILVSTGVILFDFAWFREQFCIIACPYGRFQSILMDSHSQIVAYNGSRGEPRQTPQAKALSKAHGSPLGDCVNCYRCVQVCPTGIDIRRGLQLECIACTACIDACDDIMTKLAKPTGLISYTSQKGLQGEKTKKFRLRPLLYAFVCFASVVTLTIALARTQDLDVTVLRASDMPYTINIDAKGDSVVNNHFKLELSNLTDHTLYLEFESLNAPEGLQIITALRPLPVASGAITRSDVFMRLPKASFQKGARKINLVIRGKNQNGRVHVITKEVTLVGPQS